LYFPSEDYDCVFEPSPDDNDEEKWEWMEEWGRRVEQAPVQAWESDSLNKFKHFEGAGGGRDVWRKETVLRWRRKCGHRDVP
jgi:hypothetical protein